MKIFETAWLAHAVMIIVTYGHAWTTTLTTGEARFVGSLMSALFWPLYWSVEAWK